MTRCQSSSLAEDGDGAAGVAAQACARAAAKPVSLHVWLLLVSFVELLMSLSSAKSEGDCGSARSDRVGSVSRGDEVGGSDDDDVV